MELLSFFTVAMTDTRSVGCRTSSIRWAIIASQSAFSNRTEKLPEDVRVTKVHFAAGLTNDYNGGDLKSGTISGTCALASLHKRRKLGDYAYSSSR